MLLMSNASGFRAGAGFGAGATSNFGGCMETGSGGAVSCSSIG